MKTLLTLLMLSTFFLSAEELQDTFTPLKEGDRAATHPHALWHGWDPTAEPLDTEVLHEWEEDGVVLKVIRFRVGVFKGEKAMVAAVYGYPKGARNIPALVNVHGGGQYADYRACLTNAKRGYATVSIAWAGRISAPDYSVGPNEVKLFWEGKTEDPNYRITTDWGALDAYHAPSKHGQSTTVGMVVADWTIDGIESARNNSWFLYTMAARRALTYLESQRPVVNPHKFGIYGHSMGGKITVLTAATDTRVKAAAPSCGGVSDRYNANALHRATVSDLPNLSRIKCPIIFLNPVNDFHAHFQDFATIPEEIATQDWRYSFCPQISHQDLPEHEVATQVWMDQHLKFEYVTPATPKITVNLKSPYKMPEVRVSPDLNKPILAVDVYYTQQGRLGADQTDRTNRKTRHWHHARAIVKDGKWVANLPLESGEKPLWIYANVSYALPQPIAGAGYYYAPYSTNKVALSSRPALISAEELKAANLQTTLAQTHIVENFSGDWQKEWITPTYAHWDISSHKISTDHYRAPENAQLQIKVKSEQANTLLVKLDDYYYEAPLKGAHQWETLTINAQQCKNADGATLPSFSKAYKLTITEQSRVRGKDGKSRTVGKPWKGEAPQFGQIAWLTPEMKALANAKPKAYRWTTDHMHVGVRWQPHGSLPSCNDYDFHHREIISKDSSYAQFWISWPAIEPNEDYFDYSKRRTSELKGIEQAIDLCKASGKKVELVFYHVPAWASESGVQGGFKPKAGYFAEFLTRISTYFRDKVDAYQLYHEANISFMMEGADIDFLINDIFIKGAKAIRKVYGDKPVLISTSGCSPCENCPAIAGLDAPKGGAAVNSYYDHLIANKELMSLVDALNMNVSDQNDGAGGMDGAYLTSTWGNYDLVRAKLDLAGYEHIPVISSESWITWDHLSQANDVNGDGVKDERDAYEKTITIMGQCLSRGLNTMNLPWSDNSSSWAMGLTKRVDYNGRVYSLRPEFTYPALDGGVDVITRKLGIAGGDDTFQLNYGSGDPYTEENYAVPGDPNHLHYYIWRWYAQIASGSDEVIRHAIAGEPGNDIAVIGSGFTGKERYKISSYNRTKKEFNVLLYASGAAAIDRNYTKLTIPATIQQGKHYNTGKADLDFRGEGLKEGQTFTATVETKRICPLTGQDQDVRITQASGTVKDGYISFMLHPLLPFTKITIK